MIIDPKNISTGDLHQFMLASVAPRPIAFASTINTETGVVNLAPFSFFNAFSSNPPIVVFSANRRVEGNTTKDTLANVIQNGEVVINVVSYDFVRKMAVASVDFPSDISEFTKAGFTPVASDLVRPPRVLESPVNMECKVQDIITLGEDGGAGHLIICHVIRMHVADSIIDERGRIDPDKIDLVGRMGRMNYVRASGEAVFTVMQPYKPVAIGIDQLPAYALQSTVLTGNDLGQLAGIGAWPGAEDIAGVDAEIAEVQSMLSLPLEERRKAMHTLAKNWLAKEDPKTAARIIARAEV